MKSNAFKSKVRERDENRCVLTGITDDGHQVAHFISQSLLNEKKDSDKRKEAKLAIRKFIQRLYPWLPNDYFENLDICENAIVLNYYAHRKFGSFDWFVTMETGIHGKNIYKAMQVEENGLLNSQNTERVLTAHEIAGKRIKETISSYNQPLFIGDAHPQPGFIYVKLRIIAGKFRFFTEDFGPDWEILSSIVHCNRLGFS